MMALAGGVGLAGMAGGTASASETQPNPAFETEQVVGDEDWMYDSIQAAHDDINEGGRIYVTESYDSAKESFPIVLTNHVNVTGAHRGTTVVDAADSGENVFEIREGLNDDQRPYTRTHAIEHLHIQGGEIGVLISPETSATIQHLMVQNTNSHGIASLDQKGNTGVSFMNYFHNVHVFSVGGNGFHLPFSGVNHASRLQFCIAWDNDGIGANVGGYGTHIAGGVYQGNGHHGVRFAPGANQFIRDAYLEGNGDDRRANENHEYSADVQIDNTQASIENCYFQGAGAGGQTERGVDFNGSINSHVSNCLFRNHQQGAVYVDGDSTQCDLHLKSNINWDDTYIIENNGDSTRSEGDLLPTDLSSTPGKYAHDSGYDDGTNTSSGHPEQAVWYDGAWYTWGGDVIRPS